MARNDAAATNITVHCHAHVIRRDAPPALDRHPPAKRLHRIEEYLAVLDTHGISHPGVLTAFSSFSRKPTTAAARRAGPRRRSPARHRHRRCRLRSMRSLRGDGGARAARAVGIRTQLWSGASDAAGRFRWGLPAALGKVRELDWHVEIYLEAASSRRS